MHKQFKKNHKKIVKLKKNKRREKQKKYEKKTKKLKIYLHKQIFKRFALVRGRVDET